MINWFKRNGTHFTVAGVFLVICFIYFSPAFQGKTLGQGDVLGAQSTQKEIMDYRAKDTTILWTNQIFGGMPAYQIWAPYSANIASHLVYYINYTLPSPVGMVLVLLLGTYMLFIVLKLNPWLAAAGAIAFTFTSYNMILLAAGHTNQVFAIAFFAPILAGIILIFRGKYLTGSALLALALTLEIKANHLQMTYYLMMAILILLGVELFHAIKNKAVATYLKSLGYLLAASLLAFAVNASVLWSTYEYGKDSYRGKSNLTQNAKEPQNGLSRDYIYEYSQGIAESLTFLVPNASGGASGPELLDQNSETIKVLTDKGIPEEQALGNVQQIASMPGLSPYWGEKLRGTSGPFYFGAGICFLFVLGLIIVKDRIKWWLLGTVILTMLLSFGGNWPYLSDVFLKFFPLYNKFRVVESILAVTCLCVPILAFLAIQEIINTADKKALIKKLLLALYITGGLTVVLIVLPGIFLSFKPSNQLTGVGYLTQALKGDSAMANQIVNALVKDREAFERADAIRSLVFVGLTFLIIWAFIKQKLGATAMSLIILALVLVDLWQVDKRYLKDANFTDKQEAAVPPRPVDQQIAKDPDPDFRVYDATAGIKVDVQNPFFHKTLGGYSAARMKRYDELIDNQFGQHVNPAVLNMLNAKYIITPDSSQQAQVLHANPEACGNAWFVKSIKYVDNADAEMQALNGFSPKDVALVDKQYQATAGTTQACTDSTASIKLVNYNPDHMVYQSATTAPRVAVFSEIYYDKGWKMLIDGAEKPYFRANYLLRAAAIPAGNHKVEFIFHPASYYVGEDISMAGSVLLVLLLGGAAFGDELKKYVGKKNEPVK
ncbi:YfhO family protein [Mucilaginibacter flavus]|uniref:YfhO family protein n=1 Tax=Mucilaginibacter flavus TaxID=931504 RepID=UPI0025B3A72E|nr:YfhO family protein [Mucilaginibacter flavus]MDN3579230.1 YfhO family protein [Mucilaginibacter flavus]